MFATKFLNVNNIIDYKKIQHCPDTLFSSETPEHMNQLIEIISGVVKGSRRILDMTAHVGLFSIPWAVKFPKDTITAVELLKDVYDLLEKNIKTFKCRNITAINADSMKFKKATYDFIYVDPPWRSDYSKHGTAQLNLGGVDLPLVIKHIMPLASHVFVKVPKNYDFKKLRGYKRHDITVTFVKNGVLITCPSYILLHFKQKKTSKKKTSKKRRKLN